LEFTYYARNESVLSKRKKKSRSDWEEAANFGFGLRSWFFPFTKTTTISARSTTYHSHVHEEIKGEKGHEQFEKKGCKGRKRENVGIVLWKKRQRKIVKRKKERKKAEIKRLEVH
jgi:hypothetical protein